MILPIDERNLYGGKIGTPFKNHEYMKKGMQSLEPKVNLMVPGRDSIESLNANTASRSIVVSQNF